MSNRNQAALRLPFGICAEAASMGFWDLKEAYDNSVKRCGELGQVYNLSKGYSPRTAGAYHDALVEKNDYAEHLLTLTLSEINHGSFLMDRENLELYAKELAYDVAITDITIRSLQSDHNFIAPAIRL